MERTSVCAVILAAGCGKRLGIPKAILKIGDNNLAFLQYKLLLHSGIKEISVITGCQYKIVNKTLSRYEMDITTNYSWEKGQFSSVVCGINRYKSTIEDRSWLLFMPVDTIGIRITTIQTLISNISDHQKYDAIVPSFEGRGGHPVAISPNLAKQMTTMDINTTRLDFVLKASKVKYVVVDDKNIRNNINTLNDLQQFINEDGKT